MEHEGGNDGAVANLTTLCTRPALLQLLTTVPGGKEQEIRRRWADEISRDLSEGLVVQAFDRNLIDDGNLRALACLPAIRALHIGKVHSRPAILETAGLWPKGVVSLRAPGSMLDDECVERLCSSAASETITELDLSKCDITDRALLHLAALPHLRILRVNHCEHLTTQGLVSISTHCPQLERLSAKHLENTEDELLNHLADASVPLPHLTRLSLKSYRTMFTTEGIANFIKNRGNAKQMTRLDLPRPDVCDPSEMIELGVLAIRERMPNLRCFPFDVYDLICCLPDEVTQHHWEEKLSMELAGSSLTRLHAHFFNAAALRRLIMQLPSLTSLRLERAQRNFDTSLPTSIPCPLRDLTVPRGVPPSLVASLHRLDLHHATLTLANLKDLAALPHLETLLLSFSSIELSGTRPDVELGEAFSSMPQLRHLQVLKVETRDDGGKPIPVTAQLRHQRLQSIETQAYNYTDVRFDIADCPRLRRLLSLQADLSKLMHGAPSLEFIQLDSDMTIPEIMLLLQRLPNLIRIFTKCSIVFALEESVVPSSIPCLEVLKAWRACSLSTEQFEALVRASPRLRKLRFRVTSEITTLEGLQSKSLRCIEMEAPWLEGALRMRGCPNLACLRLKKRSQLTEIVLVGMQELTELHIPCSATVKRLIIKDNPRLRLLSVNAKKRADGDGYEDDDERDEQVLPLDEVTIESEGLVQFSIGGGHLLFGNLLRGAIDLPKVERFFLSKTKPVDLDALRQVLAEKLPSLKQARVDVLNQEFKLGLISLLPHVQFS